MGACLCVEVTGPGDIAVLALGVKTGRTRPTTILVGIHLIVATVLVMDGVGGGRRQRKRGVSVGIICGGWLQLRLNGGGGGGDGKDRWWWR